ncbi:MAG: AMP-binding protein, partial [Bacteroidetes bacterium]|nr:AMP-binding protein [Bacteroidota bacterium]
MPTINQETYPWLKAYPKGVPYEINPEAYPSLLELMEEGFRQYAAQAAYSNMGKELTFGEIDRLSGEFAAYLQSLGLQKGDRVAIQMPNLLQYPVALYGALKAGLVVVNANPLYTAHEMRKVFIDSGATA